MKPRIPLEQIAPALKEHGFTDRDIRTLRRNAFWKGLEYRNHQMYFLRKNDFNYGNHQLTENELGQIFGVAETTIQKALQDGYRGPKTASQPSLLTDEEETRLVAEILKKEQSGKPI